MKRRISILHPSRQRPEIASQTAELWLNNADDKDNIEYILCLDLSDPLGYQYAPYFGGSYFKKCIKDNKSAIQAINEGAKVSTGDLLLVVSDDFICEPHWDTRLLEALEGKEDFLVKTPDGIQKTLITLPLMDRTYYNRFGYIYNPIYVHMHSDEEMTCVGMMLGKVINLDIPFIHNHYSTGRFEKDSINKKNDASWNQGKKVITDRYKKNFGIKNPVMRHQDIVWH